VQLQKASANASVANKKERKYDRQAIVSPSD